MIYRNCMKFMNIYYFAVQRYQIQYKTAVNVVGCGWICHDVTISIFVKRQAWERGSHKLCLCVCLFLCVLINSCCNDAYLNVLI